MKFLLPFLFSGFACGWFPAEEHRSDEGHAESCEDPRNPGHDAGALQRDDEGDLGLTLHPIPNNQEPLSAVWQGAKPRDGKGGPTTLPNDDFEDKGAAVNTE